MVDQLVLHTLGAGTPLLLLLHLAAATAYSNSLPSSPRGRPLVIDGRHVIEGTILSTPGSVREVRVRLIGSLLPLVTNQEDLRFKRLTCSTIACTCSKRGPAHMPRGCPSTIPAPERFSSIASRRCHGFAVSPRWTHRVAAAV